MIISRRIMTALLFTLSIAVSSCAKTLDASPVCSRAPELESSLVAVDSAIVALADVSSRQLQSMFAVLLSSFAAIGDIAPVEIADQFVTVESAYHQVSVALQNVYWEGTVGVSDAAVLAALDDLSRNDNIDALTSVRTYISDSCQVKIVGGVNKSPGDELNLPSPSIDVEPQPDLNTGFDNEESAIRSYAYFVAERFNVALTTDQALCVGTALTDGQEKIGVLTDKQFDALVTSSFEKCLVDVAAATVVGS